MKEVRMEEVRMEACDRCGGLEFDRRTLWMACFYAMEELKIPFKEVELLVSISREDAPKTRAFYTLRVCKDCRADWMRAIKNWFTTKPVEQESCGSGIFIRENGRNVEITEEEWSLRQGASTYVSTSKT